MKKKVFGIVLCVLILVSAVSLSEAMDSIELDQFSISLPSRYVSVSGRAGDSLLLNSTIPSDPQGMGGQISFINIGQGFGEINLFDSSTAKASFSSMTNLIISSTKEMMQSNLGISDVQILSFDVIAIDSVPVISARFSYLIDYYTLGVDNSFRVYSNIMIASPTYDSSLTIMCITTDEEEFTKVCDQYLPTLRWKNPSAYPGDKAALNLREIIYQEAVALLDSNQYSEAYPIFGVLSVIDPYKDAPEKSLYCHEQLNNTQPADEEGMYQQALSLYNSQQYLQAEALCRMLQFLYSSDQALELRLKCLSAAGIYQ